MNDDELRKWGLTDGEKLRDLSIVNAAKLVEIADNLGGFLGKKNESSIDLKVNQIRRFLDAVRRIEAELKGRGKSEKKPFDLLKDEIILLRPKLAYAAGREKKVRPLLNVLDPAIRSAALSKDNFTKLVKLIEGIIAYHRFYDGKN